jgi:hypothetical protein
MGIADSRRKADSRLPPHHRPGNFYIEDESLPWFLFPSPRGPTTSRLNLKGILSEGSGTILAFVRVVLPVGQSGLLFRFGFRMRTKRFAGGETWKWKRNRLKRKCP